MDLVSHQVIKAYLHLDLLLLILITFTWLQGTIIRLQIDKLVLAIKLGLISSTKENQIS